MNIKLKKFGFFVCIALLFSACETQDKYSDVPQIEFEEYEKFGSDSIVLTISYVDGDGDLGLGPEHDKPPFDSGKYKNNLIVNYYERFNGSFSKTTPDPFPDNKNDTVFFPFRFRNLTPKGKNKAIEGEISITISDRLRVYSKNFPERNYGGQILFEIYIYDRALNKSNTVSSPPIPFKGQ